MENYNKEKLHAYYEKHIKGRKYGELDPDKWEVYSDWYKELYGHRPRPWFTEAE